jgi:hypothetical protein
MPSRTTDKSEFDSRLVHTIMETKKLEKDIQREICDWLDSEGYFFWRNNTVPVFQQDKYGARFRKLPKYTPRGLPDIIILYFGEFIGLEVKVPNYWKFTDDQQAMMDKIRQNGGAYHLVTSLSEAQELMGVHKRLA